jgi:hypothetical protein
VSLISFGYLRNETRDQNSRFVRVEENRLRDLLRALLRDVEVDEKWYMDANSDVRAAFRQGKVSSARDHYIESGYFEDRFPRPIRVDAEWYLKTYPDIGDAIRARRFASAQEHFEKYGFKEGRKPFEGWSLVADAAKPSQEAEAD